MTMDLERGMEMINQNKNQTNGNGFGENKNERGKNDLMTRAMMVWRKGWRGGQWLGGDIFSGECYSDHELEAHVLLFDTIFFFLLSNSYFLSLFSLCSIFSRFLSLYSIPKPLGIRRCFQQKHRTSIHTHKRTKYKVPTNAKKVLEWERGERAKLSLPLLCTFTQLKWRKVHSSSSAC